MLTHQEPLVLSPVSARETFLDRRWTKIELPKLTSRFWKIISAFSLQSTLWLRPELAQKTQQSQLLYLTTPLSLTPPVRLAGAGTLVCSFQTFGNTQPTLPYAIITHLNLMWLLYSSYKTPDCGNLPPSWLNSTPLPRGAGWPPVLIPGGWQSNFSLWRLQHVSGQAFCYRLPFTPYFIWSHMPYHYKHAQIRQPTWLKLNTQLYCCHDPLLSGARNEETRR